MMKSKLTRTELKRLVVPVLAELGFNGKFPHFMRKIDDRLDLLSFEFDKWGGGFFLEFCSTSCGDAIMSWGECVPEQTLTVAHVAADNRARLQAIGGKSSCNEYWFRFEDLEQSQIVELALKVADLLGQVELWLSHGIAGANISFVE